MQRPEDAYGEAGEPEGDRLDSGLVVPESRGTQHEIPMREGFGPADVQGEVAPRARVEGRFDRVQASTEGPVVGDYKTSGNLKKRVHLTSMLKGLTLQVPLYHLLAGEASEVELLGVGPAYPGDETGEPEVAAFAGFDTGEQSEGFRETLRVLLGLARAGRFPLMKGEHCRWCAWSRACRRKSRRQPHSRACPGCFVFGKFVVSSAVRRFGSRPPI